MLDLTGHTAPVTGAVRNAGAGITANEPALGLMQSAGGPGIQEIADGIPVGR